ncbi:MAG: bifunctional DNA-formamidopyrimidine glycosylase/DNA-(apurinic or apyrimidinic site) lyase [Deltaproteobacteria bacterium]|nr:bifunctional DNA-formamidopyrimidine glycosylase/DNA-(apurinic or apyrimidinic site) lyase [Deltaproteobacteria bacterium]
MPELPEIETICRGLRGRLPGRKIVAVQVFDRRLRSPVSQDFSSQLLHRVIVRVERRGKYILIFLEEDKVWLSHLGMSGKLICVKADRHRVKHDHIVAGLSDGYEVRYHDPRRFGLSLVVSHSELEGLPQLHDLGMDPLDQRFGGGYLHTAARNSKRRIRDLLIDQRVIAGVGNIYANEILFRAGIRPTRRAWQIARSKLESIARETPLLLREAIRWCGTSFSDYRDAEDRFGEFQNHLRVYDREGEPCRVCGAQIRRVPVGNRSAFYCPKCQR